MVSNRRDTQEFEMKRRQLFKHLKERKLFTKYCLAMAQAFSNPERFDKWCIRRPRTSLNDYIGFRIRFYETKGDMDCYINAVDKDWRIIQHSILIQY